MIARNSKLSRLVISGDEDGAIGVTDHDAEIPTSREIADVVHVVGPTLHHDGRVLRDASGTVAKLAPAIVSPAIHVSIAAVREAMSRPGSDCVDGIVWPYVDRRCDQTRSPGGDTQLRKLIAAPAVNCSVPG